MKRRRKRAPKNGWWVDVDQLDEALRRAAWVEIERQLSLQVVGGGVVKIPDFKWSCIIEFPDLTVDGLPVQFLGPGE